MGTLVNWGAPSFQTRAVWKWSQELSDVTCPQESWRFHFHRDSRFWDMWYQRWSNSALECLFVSLSYSFPCCPRLFWMFQNRLDISQVYSSVLCHCGTNLCALSSSLSYLLTCFISQNAFLSTYFFILFILLPCLLQFILSTKKIDLDFWLFNNFDSLERSKEIF